MRTHRVSSHLVALTLICLPAMLPACGSSKHASAAPPRFLYVANMESHEIAGFRIGGPTGGLESIGSPAPATAEVRVLVATPDGAFLYGANQDTGRINAYGVDPATGALTELSGGNPSPYETPRQIIELAIDPAGRYLYSCNSGGTITGFAIGADGTLTLIGNFTSALYDVATAGRVHPSGKWLFVSTQGPNTVTRWTIGADGSLGEAVAVEVGGNNGGLAIDPSGTFLYVTTGATSSLWGFQIDATTGALAPTTPASFDLGGPSGGSIAIAPGGKYLYVDSWGDMKLHGFTIESNGSLTPTSTPTVSLGSGFPVAIAFDPDGKLLYAGMGDGGTIASARLDQATGTLTVLSPSVPSGGTFPAGVVVIGGR